MMFQRGTEGRKEQQIKSEFSIVFTMFYDSCSHVEEVFSLLLLYSFFWRWKGERDYMGSPGQ